MSEGIQIRRTEDYAATPEFLALLNRYGLAELYIDMHDTHAEVWAPEGEHITVPLIGA